MRWRRVDGEAAAWSFLLDDGGGEAKCVAAAWLFFLCDGDGEVDVFLIGLCGGTLTAAASWLWCLLVLASPLKIVFYVTAMARLIVRQRRVSFLFAAAASGLHGGALTAAASWLLGLWCQRVH